MSDDTHKPTIDPPTYTELQAAAGDDFVRELVDTFLEEAPLMLAELHSALAAANADAFRRAAHSLKSNSQTFGALTLAAMARALEMNPLPTEASALDALAHEYARTAAALAELRDA